MDFKTPSELLIYWDGKIEDDMYRLDGIEAVHVYAEDFEDSGGSPEEMPVEEYDTGLYAGFPDVNEDYYYPLPDEDFANAHQVHIQGMVNAIPAQNVCQIRMYPRGQSNSWCSLDFGRTLYHISYKYMNGNTLMGDLAMLRRASVDTWMDFKLRVLNKYLFDSHYRNDNEFGFDLHNLYDPLLVSPSAIRGRLRSLNWSNIEDAFLRAPSRVDGDADNPAVLDLYPFKKSIVLPKNDPENSIEVTAEMRAAMIAGTFKMRVELVGEGNRTSHLFGGTLSGTHNQDTGLQMVGINETQFGAGDNFTSGGLLSFPDDPEVGKFRIVAGFDDRFFCSEEISSDLIYDGHRFDVEMPSAIPLLSGYPINEVSPIVISLPYSGDVGDFLVWKLGIPSVGDKIVLGAAIQNAGDFSQDQIISEIVYTIDPAPACSAGQMSIRRKPEMRRR
jgi:hypothetical protein